MYKLIQAVLNSDEKTVLRKLIDALSRSGKRYFLRNEILQVFADCHCDQQQVGNSYHGSSLSQLIHYTHEIILDNESIWLLLRPWIAIQQAWKLTSDLSSGMQMPSQDFLNACDRQVNRSQPHILTLDFSLFDQAFPAIDDPRNMGQGLEFLNRHLCDKLLTEPQYWEEALFKALQVLQYDDLELIINDQIHSGIELAEQVKQALTFLEGHGPDNPYETIHLDLQALGFEPGWGNTVARVRETLELLNRLMEDPAPAILEAFVSRVPAVFRVVLISVHGWVGQESVLGRPETRSQVAYVLDQAYSLEHQLRTELQQAGLDVFGIRPQVIILTRLIPNCTGTQCILPFERVEGTENAWILRVPFREFNPKVTQNWISKFEIWPYLESFADDAETALREKFGGSPNLVIGNYSDGNLVASILARRFRAIQCNIAHSLEKSKYLFSNLHWQEMENPYHFSAQFTADLLSMNAADFIVTSSNQEIVGTPGSIGQYESYKCFTMPGLYHVVDGINLFNPKFNRVPPSINEQIFFPYQQSERRDADALRVRDLIFADENPHIRGHLDDPNKRPILAVAPITLVKNLAGLAKCFGQSEALKARCNLIILTNAIDQKDAVSAEESDEIAQLSRAIDEYHLQGHIRWIGLRLPTQDLGEVYRVIADRQGIFVNFSLFEAVGRTILEAMISGLPTFATQFGGALEIIQDGHSGFHINPTNLDETAQKILHFLDQCDADPQSWQAISDQAIQRIHEQYSWPKHSQQLLRLTKVYSFWNYTNPNGREALHRYLEALFYLLYKPRADDLLAEHMQR